MPAGGVGPAEAEAYAGLRPEVARDRLCRAVAARGTVRLRDLADAEALDLFSFPRPGSPAGAGWELLRAGVGRGPGTTAGAGGLRRVAARAGTAVRVPGALLRGRPVRIRCAEPSAAVDLATDLRAVAVEVVLLDQPGRGSYVRTVLRAAVDDAVVVGGHLVPAPTVVVPAGASRPEALRQVLARLNQAGFSRPRSS